MKNLIIRALSGAVYVALIIGSILFGGKWGFPILCCVFTFLGIIEFQKMTRSDMHESPLLLLVDVVLGMSLLSLTAAIVFNHGIVAVLSVALIAAMIPLRFVSQLYSHSKSPLHHMAISIMSIVYIALPMAAAIMVSGNKPLLLLMFAMIWLNDTGAYLVGCTIGSHRLFPRLSPKKSWEGFFGGMAFTIAAAYLAKTFLPNYFAEYNYIMLITFAVIVTIVSTWGDLFESMLKRNVGVKDSGNLIPGHGGILDRIDSLLFVAPATYLFLSIVFFYFSVDFFYVN